MNERVKIPDDYGRGEQIYQESILPQRINHPEHYGGHDNPYETIKVIEAWELGFNLGNVLKYISRAGKKPGVEAADDLQKARWYLEREIQKVLQDKVVYKESDG